MSVESETPIEPTPKPLCGICETAIADDNIGLVCKCEACGKLMCLTCVKKMIDVMFGQPTLHYPFHCGLCSELLDESFFLEYMIKQGQYEKYIACLFPLFWSKYCLEENEVLAQCPFCPYFEIHTTDACSLQFLTCQHPSCSKKSCLICLHAIDDDNIESKHHSHCHELSSYKQMIEQAIELGSQQRCPYCRLTGIKDDGCTHMVCQRCGHTWCYLCGMKENECLVGQDVVPNLSAHNEDWHLNKGRCPMSLGNIHELDVRWPEDDRDCLEYFHRYQTSGQLFNVLKSIGEEKFDEVNQYFGIINASGYTIDEIKDYENRIFIDYSSNTNE